MEENIKISVVLPSYNTKEYIKKCIESVINQSLKEIEIICVDGESDDGTLEILEDYAKKDNRITILRTDIKSEGHQLNLGIEKSKGEYIGIVETDDYIDEKMYEKLWDLSNNGSCDIAKVNFFNFIDSNPPIITRDTLKETLPNNEEFTVYQKPNFLLGHPSMWAAIYKKSFLKENNIKFIEAPGGGFADNVFLHQTAFCAKSILYSDDPFYYYRISNPNSSTNRMGDLTLILHRMIDILDILDEYSCNNQDIVTVVYYRIFYHIKDVLRRDLGDQKHEVFTYLKEIFGRLDGEIIEKQHFPRADKFIYRSMSPKCDENSFSTKTVMFLIKLADRMNLL